MAGPNLARMAWRNLLRNRRRTLITLVGVAFGMMFSIIFTGLGDASWGSMIDFAARLGGGHVTLQHPDYLELPALKRTVKDVDKLVALSRAEPGVIRVTTRITGQIMLSTASESRGGMFIAFDPKSEDNGTLGVLDAVKDGQLFAGSDGRGIVLGRKLADALSLKTGRKVVFTLTDKHGEIVRGMARLSGIIETGADTVDGGMVLLPIDAVRKSLGYDANEATQVAVFVGDHRQSDALAASLQAKVGAKVAALPWHVTMAELAGFISMKVGGTIFMEVLILLLLAAGIFNTLFVSVMERLREFGVLLAIGFSPSGLFRLVMWESLWLALMGLVASAIATAWPYYHLNVNGLDISKHMGGKSTEVAGVAMTQVMRVDIFPENALMIVGVAVTATLLAGLYPAWRAGRVSPVDAIKLV